MTFTLLLCRQLHDSLEQVKKPRVIPGVDHGPVFEQGDKPVDGIRFRLHVVRHRVRERSPAFEQSDDGFEMGAGVVGDGGVRGGYHSGPQWRRPEPARVQRAAELEQPASVKQNFDCRSVAMGCCQV
jgi:hypothetical protein